MLEVSNGTVPKGTRLDAFPQVASQGWYGESSLESSFLQSAKALEPVGVDR